MKEETVPDYAVEFTEEEWNEQRSLRGEYLEALSQQDRQRASEILPGIIAPSYVLKSIKRLRGADYIRKMGYNTTDADLVYGPGWLDVDDGGPDIKREYEP